jgi:hypothetical protein
MRLLLSHTIRREWQVRCIGDVVPGLAAYGGEAYVDIDANTAQDIAADCRFQADPKAIDQPPGVRLAYEALQIRLTRLFGPELQQGSAQAAPSPLATAAADATGHTPTKP